MILKIIPFKLLVQTGVIWIANHIHLEFFILSCDLNPICWKFPNEVMRICSYSSKNISYSDVLKAAWSVHFNYELNGIHGTWPSLCTSVARCWKTLSSNRYAVDASQYKDAQQFFNFDDICQHHHHIKSFICEWRDCNEKP